MFKNKRGVAPFIIVLILALVLVYTGILSLTSFGLGAFTDLSKVYKLNWGHIECVQNADYNIVYTRYADDVQLYKCDDYTNECLIQAQLDRDPGYFFKPLLYYSVCDLTGTSCSAPVMKGFSSQSDVFSYTLPKGKSFKVVISGAGWSTTRADIMQISKKVKTFYIRGVENGNVFVQESCVLSADLRGKTASSGLNELTFSGTNQRQNYVTDFIEVATQLYKYNSQDVICQSRILYAVSTQAMKDGSIVKVQGNTIKGVECCPQEANCDASSFTFLANVVKECTYSSECPNGGMPIAETSTSYHKFTCSSQGTCVQSSAIATECTNDQACVLKYGQGSVCDLSTNNYGKCKVQTTSGYCGDSKCDSLAGEDGTTCPADCTNCPPAFIYNTAEKKCEPMPSAGWPIWVWLIIVFIVFLLLVKFVPALRRLFKSIPVIGWITP